MEPEEREPAEETIVEEAEPEQETSEGHAHIEWAGYI
ncbi:hypothetical protein PAESOLCIP111_03394 [Paenibacillus solanacearum]|uniref:Uncharacterized protein n=1 Tax=Paenibacillus solanacearum TaxID=2048548 RepID=A0A916K3X6_9BACL|nr:hypothetical protein PAESOLCIP111_03394 [Paenibacillus solanacearum]